MPEIRPPRSPRRHRLEIIPLIDIMFFLLATFLMVSLGLLQNEGIALNLPPARSSRPEEDPAKTITLSIGHDGRVFIQNQTVTAKELSVYLAGLGRVSPEVRLILQGDARADFGRVVAVLDEARRAGLHKLTIRTTQPETR